MHRLILIAIVAAATCLSQDGSTGQNWPHYLGSQSGWRHSSLNQISNANVKRLAPVWTFQTGDYEGGLQSTPIVIDGVMYLGTSRNRVFALNAATGALLWQYTYPLPKTFTTFYGPWNRGVAVGHGHVYVG